MMTTEEECSRMHCVEKVRTLLEECLGPPNETAFLNFDRCLENELPLSVEEIPDQTISFQNFLDRITTFRPQYWGADPNAILQFAKYGWRCSDKFTIKCDVCLSTVECSSLMQKPELWTLVSHKAHEKLCFWTGCPCPDRFTKITINPKILKKKMTLYLMRTVALGSDLPSISKDVLASMNITNETLDALFEILDTQQTEETVSALVLAICGWLNGEVDRAMNCGYCKRQILFNNFFSIMDKSEKQSVSESQTSVSGDHSQNADKMDVCDEKSSVSEKVTVNSPANNGQNIANDEVCLENVGENFKSHVEGEVNSCDNAEVITPNASAVNESDSAVLPKSDAVCTVGELTGIANATDGNDSESKTSLVSGKEASEELGNVLLEPSLQLNENVSDTNSKSNEKSPLKMQSEEQCDEHLESKINEVAKESGRMLNGGASEDSEVAHENVADIQSSKKRKLQDDDDTVDTENFCTDDQQSVKKVCLQKSLAIEKNGECQEADEMTDKKGKKDSVTSFNNCHNLVNERSAISKTEILPPDRVNVNSEQLCRNLTDIDEKYDRSCEENEMSDTDSMLQISETYSLATPMNSDNNSVSATEETPIIKTDTVSTKLNGDAPAFVSDSIQVPNLNTLKDADIVSVSESEDVKGCSSVIENDENKELHEQIKSKSSECEMKVSGLINASESLDVPGNATPNCEASKESVSDENGVLKDSVCAGLTDNSEFNVAKSETIHRTSDCENRETNLGKANDGEGNCDRIENSGDCILGPVDDSNTAKRESCEMETESSSVGNETCKKSGKRKLEDSVDEDNFQSKRNKPADDAFPKKQFHPVEEHRYWCIWKLQTKDRGVQKEGWRQVLDYLKLSPPTPVEQPTPDFYGEVKKLFSLLGDW